MAKAKSAPQIFLSYAREDQELVEKLYERLISIGFKPWMDVKDILPGEIWMESIHSAIQKSDFFLACLSPHSVSKRGVLQKEFKSALDIWPGMLKGDIYFIPVRLTDCVVPESMCDFQWVDLFAKDGFMRLEKALKRGVELRTGPAKPAVRKPIVSPAKIGEAPHPIDDFGPSRSKTGNKSGKIAGILLGAFLAVVGLPLTFNNYVYKVERPAIPETCQVSSKEVRVGLSSLPDCSSTFQTQLADHWKGETLVTSIIPQPFATSAEARRVANYDLVIWGACSPSDPETADLTFELTTSRKPYGVYEPSSLRVSGSPGELSDAGLALAAYQHGDYTDAANRFKELPGLSNPNAIALFRSNSLLFAALYDEAIASYEKIAKATDNNSAAAYNNMGMAYFTRDPERGFEEFDRSISLAKEQHAVDVEILALVNRSEYFQWQHKWENALDDCEASLGLNGHSALPYLCLANYYRALGRSQPSGWMPLNEIGRNIDEAAKYEDAPALLYYFRADWVSSHLWVKKQDAVDAYWRFLSELEYQACLQEDKQSIENAKKQLVRLTHP